MAYFSRPSAMQLWRRGCEDTSVPRIRDCDSVCGGELVECDGGDRSTLAAAGAGIAPASFYQAKVRCLVHVPAPEEGLPDRVWTGEQDGGVAVRDTDGEVVDSVFRGSNPPKITAMAHACIPKMHSHDYNDHHVVYCGDNKGGLRVFRPVAARRIALTSFAGVTWEAADPTVVRSVRADSEADSAGLRAGHRVVAVGASHVLSSQRPPCIEHGPSEVLVDCIHPTARGFEPEYDEVGTVIRKHTGAIEAMQVISDDFTSLPVLVTCSSDWQARLWTWEVKRRQQGAAGQLYTKKEFADFVGEDDAWIDAGPGTHRLVPGKAFTHSKGALHSVCYLKCGADAARVFLAGDDARIHCWNLSPSDPLEDFYSHKQQPGQPGRFPAKGHKGPVTALATVRRFLCSASRDGTVRVWDSASGMQLKVLHRAKPGQHLLSLAAHGSRLWSGGSDGVVRVHDLSSTQPALMCELDDNMGHMVSRISAMPRPASGNVVWALDSESGQLQVWYCGPRVVSDSGDWAPAPVPRLGGEERTGFSEAERLMVGDIHLLQCSVLGSSEAVRRSKLVLLRNRRSALRAALVAARKLSGVDDARCMRERFFALLRFRKLRKAEHARAVVARALLHASGRSIAGTYFKKLRAHAALSKRVRRKQRLASAVLSATERGTQIAYWKHLCQYTRMKTRQKARRRAARAVLKCTRRGRRFVALQKWRLFAEQRSFSKRRVAAAQCMLLSSRQSAMRLYYSWLDGYRQHTRMRRRLREAAVAVITQTARGLAHVSWGRWVKFCAIRTSQKLKQKALSAAQRFTATGIRRLYYTKCLAYTALQASADLKGKVELAKGQVAACQRRVQQNDTALRDLTAEEDALTLEIARAKQEIAERRQEAADMTRLRDKAAQELLQTFEPDPVHTVVQQADRILFEAKAAACNCRSDFDSMKKTRADVQAYLSGKGGKSPVVTCMQGVDEIEKAIQEVGYRTAGNHWKVWLHEFDGLMAGRVFRKRCHDGLKQIVIGWDYLKGEPERRRDWVSSGNGAALLRNRHILDCIIRRAKQHREMEDEEAMLAALAAAQEEEDRRGGLNARRLSGTGWSAAGSPSRRMSIGSVPRCSSARRSSSMNRPAAARTIRVSSWCLAGPPATANPFTYQPPAKAITDRTQRAVYRCLTEAAEEAMDPTTSLGSAPLHELLCGDDDPLLELKCGGVETKPLHVADVAALRKHLSAQGVGEAWLDEEVAAYTSSAQHRWRMWRGLTVSQFVRADGSGDPTGSSMQACVPQLTLAAADAAHRRSQMAGDRARRNAWRADSAPPAAASTFSVGDSSPHDFFKLRVWDAIQSRVAAAARQRTGAPAGDAWTEGLEALGESLRTLATAAGSSRDRIEKALGKLRGTGSCSVAVVLTGVPKSMICSGALREMWDGNVAHLKPYNLAAEGNTVVLLADGFEQMSTPHPFRDADDQLSPVCFSVRLREKVSDTRIQLVAVGLPFARGAVEHYAAQMDREIGYDPEYTIVAGEFGGSLRDTVTWSRLVGCGAASRSFLARFLHGARDASMWGAEGDTTQCVRLSLFQSTVGRIGRDTCKPGTYVLPGSGLGAAAIGGHILEGSVCRLPDADIPSVHVPVTILADIGGEEPPAGDVRPLRGSSLRRSSSTGPLPYAAPTLSSSLRDEASAAGPSPGRRRSPSVASVRSSTLPPPPPPLSGRRGSLSARSPSLERPPVPLPRRPSTGDRPPATKPPQRRLSSASQLRPSAAPQRQQQPTRRASASGTQHRPAAAKLSRIPSVSSTASINRLI